MRNESDAPVRFHWVRKAYEFVEGLEVPKAFVTNEQDIAPIEMPGTEGRWATTRFVDPADVRHDMHVNIVTFQPGGVIPLMKPMSWSTAFMCSKARPCIT
ncbi:hypothetical protein HSBAA_51530 [Vreelandella sulfidaeris]|uniref:Uncharacterized protein n=1 Tax=Vreelandella sulfidaeris TaxID=115553 RepID=A0A455UDY9_9GAMM|nr:hypothetical protein HSBAA_51530 [Halomonas sulfidaeris]